MKISVAALLLFLAGVLPAAAAMYTGWADTGWSYYDKSECCADAIADAQEDSAVRCETAGGWAQPRYGGHQRGNCRWRWRQDAWGQRVYRCEATAKLRCK